MDRTRHIASLNPCQPVPADVCDLYLERLGAKVKRVRLGYDRDFDPYLIISKNPLKDDIARLDDQGRRSRHSKVFSHLSEETLPRRYAYSVDDPPGVWILSGNDFDHHQSIVLYDKGITKVAVATVSLTERFMHNTYKSRDWFIWTFTMNFDSTASTDSKEHLSARSGSRRPADTQAASSGTTSIRQ